MTGVGSSNVKTSARAGARIWRGLFLKVVAAELVTFEHTEGAVVDARRRHDDNPPKTRCLSIHRLPRGQPPQYHIAKSANTDAAAISSGIPHTRCPNAARRMRPAMHNGPRAEAAASSRAIYRPPAAAHSRARHRHLAKRPACRCEPVFSVSGRSEMNRLKRILNDQTIRENRASQARPREENHLDGVPPDKGK
ncbi:hypothetical protein [Burkholderia pseudomallei]|uniref:hypothetical protein n=1 Tax=Burkholderia pseudomallei TaxID=28450 RepID=UPI001F50FAB4|nr:hypothetical protein [Burkholderia pseudomallei]